MPIIARAVVAKGPLTLPSNSNPNSRKCKKAALSQGNRGMRQ